MVEETTAAAQTLSDETNELAATISSFKVAGRSLAPAKSGSRGRPGPTRSHAAASPVVQMKHTGGGGSAPRGKADESWAEF